jgi:predicted negative regulator of RcsB-dependent stress response
MARHPTARRVPPPPPTADDVFIERVLETTAWAKSHTRLLVIGAATLAVLLAGFFYYRNYTTALRNRAETELTLIRPTVLSGNASLAVRDLEAFLARYGNTPTAREARLLLAQAYLESGQAQNAIQQVEPLASNVDDPLGVSAAFLLAGAQEAMAQPDRAVETYLRIADDADQTFQKQRALDAAARIRFEQGNAAAAVQLYDRLLGSIEQDNPDRPIYELRRAEAAARSQAGAGSGD